MSDIFRDLEHEWHAIEHGAADWFARHARPGTTPGHYGDTITAGPPPATGAPMSLASIVGSIENRVKEGEAALGAILQEHLPQAATLASLLETNPIFASVENALHVPKSALDGVAKILDELAAAYPKPSDGSAPEAAPAVAETAQQVN